MIPTFTKTFSKQDARMCLASYNLERLYEHIEPYIKGGFENNDNMSNYDMFLKINLKNRDSHQYLPKYQFDQGYCILNKQQITQGSLPEIETEGMYCNIRLGELVINENTTVGQFAQAVVDNNEGFEYNDQITFIYGDVAHNRTDNLDYTQFSAAKVSLEENNELLLSTLDVLDNIPYINGFQSNNGKLAYKVDNTKFDSNTFLLMHKGYTWIHSRDENGKLKVSTQHLFNPDNTNFSSEVHYKDALRTFGYDENFADTLPYLKPEKPNPPFISGGYMIADTGCKIYYTCSIGDNGYITANDPDLNDIGDDPTIHTKLYHENEEIHIPDNMQLPVYITINAIAVSSSGRKSDISTDKYVHGEPTSQQEI